MERERQAAGCDERLRAAADDPRIGVHKLTEFIFCPRAGLLAMAQRQDRDDAEEDPTTSFTPLWEERRIEQQLQVELKRIRRMLLIGAAFVLVGVAGWLLKYPLVPLISFLVVGLSAGRFLDAWERVEILKERLELARGAVPDIPDADSLENQRVNWWSLLKAGFESDHFEAALVDEALQLDGSPWRVLRKDSLRIPVFLLRRYDQDREFEIKNQHMARIAAYCHLLEHCLHAQSPYGIVLLAGSYDGWTIPNGLASQTQFHAGLIEARRVIRSDAAGEAPYQPRPEKCSGCPWGAPFVHIKGEPRQDGLSVPVFGQAGDDGRTYHSSCGDRFRWVPPHRKADEKGLL